MSERNKPRAAGANHDPYQGFALSSVCWGYREIFSRTIEKLFDQGVIGPDRRDVTAKFFELMKNADQCCFDHVLKQLLGAMNPSNRWLMELPGIFVDVMELGRQFAQSKMLYGIRYFEVLGAGGFGDTPAKVQNLMTHLNRLRQTDEELAVAFLKGYKTLAERLTPPEIGRYLREGLRIFERNRSNGLAFMECALKTSETYIVHITRECRLSDIQGALAALLKALTGTEFEIGDLGQLDSDDLIERGSTTICMYKWLYLPRRIRHFDRAEANRNWYLLMGLASAALLDRDSFPQLHGHPEYPTCASLVGGDPLKLALFQVIEYTRALRHIRNTWPGARRLVDFGIRTEFRNRPPASPAETLLWDAVGPDAPRTDGARELIRQADASANCFDTASRLSDPWVETARRDYPGLDRARLRAFAFLPDFLFPAKASVPPLESFIADLKDTAQRNRSGRNKTRDDEKASRAPGQGDGKADEEDNERMGEAKAAFVYDEWDYHENDYRENYCFLYERAAEGAEGAAIPADIAEEARRVGQVFERFKPELARREKFLPDGDIINPDLLLDYLVQRNNEPSPKVNFYERPLIKRRDLAVLVLLDASGSTNEEAGSRKKVIDLEKHAALILGQGLAALDDRFAICAFSSNGPENCAFFVYKEFDEPWDNEGIRRVLGARPHNSTRIGPALRHSGYRLSRLEARQRLIILITDGKPMDSGYDPNSRYAQHDVRMACEENARQAVHTFAISTEENSVADMEIMFPGRRFAILSDIRQLPRILPKLYVRLTM